MVSRLVKTYGLDSRWDPGVMLIEVGAVLGVTGLLLMLCYSWVYYGTEAAGWERLRLAAQSMIPSRWVGWIILAMLICLIVAIVLSAR